MGLLEQQAALARLFSDTALAARYVVDPEEVALECGLVGDDALQVGAICRDDILFFARSLAAKRLGEVRTCLPMTLEALGERFDPLFARYCESNRIGPETKRHAFDALRFTAFLLSQSEISRGTARRETIRYESLALDFELARRCFRIALFHGLIGYAPTVRPERQYLYTLGLWVRTYPRARSRQWLWPIIGRCMNRLD